MSGFLAVKNFDRFQHYKDRSPPWIKLYNDLLDDYAFSTLPDASKSHLMLIWLLASRTDNRIPNDPKWIGARIGARENVDLGVLLSAEFLITLPIASKTLANCSVSARPEGEGEREEETEQNGGANAPLPGSAAPNADEAPRDRSEELKARRRAEAEAVRRVWDHFLTTSNRRRKLTEDRRSKIKVRLRSYSVEDLCRAIDGAHRNPFYCGENDRETYYGDIETIFKNDAAVEKHMEWAEGANGDAESPQQQDPATADAERRQKVAAEEERQAAARAKWKAEVLERLRREPEEVRADWRRKIGAEFEHLRGSQKMFNESVTNRVCELYGAQVGITVEQFMESAA